MRLKEGAIAQCGGYEFGRWSQIAFATLQNCFACLCLSFLICKAGMVIIS